LLTQRSREHVRDTVLAARGNVTFTPQNTRVVLLSNLLKSAVKLGDAASPERCIQQLREPFDSAGAVDEFGTRKYTVRMHCVRVAMMMGARDEIGHVHEEVRSTTKSTALKHPAICGKQTSRLKCRNVRCELLGVVRVIVSRGS